MTNLVRGSANLLKKWVLIEKKDLKMMERENCIQQLILENIITTSNKTKIEITDLLIKKIKIIKKTLNFLSITTKIWT